MDQNPQPQDQQPAEAPAPVQQVQAPAATSTENPGQLFGILSIVADFIGLAVVGIVLGVLSRNKSKAANQATTLGTVGMVLGIVFTVLGLIWFLFVGLAVIVGIQEGATTTTTTTSSSLYE